MRKTLWCTAVLTLVLGLASPAAADEVTVRVDSNGDHGWTFNPDPAYDTPYEFSTAESVLGSGTLYVPPITNTNNGPADKFIAVLEANIPAHDFEYFDYSVMPVAGPGATFSPSQYYVNLYVNLPGSTTFYDCRYNMFSSFLQPGWWYSAGFSRADAGFSLPGAVTDRSGDGYTCPSSLVSLPAGSTLSRIALNVGDTSSGDTGLGAYIDAAWLYTVANRSTTRDTTSTRYDFEAPPTSRTQCLDGGYAAFEFRSPGECISSIMRKK